MLLFSAVLFNLCSFAHLPDTLVWETITFEQPYEYLSIDTSAQNIWQIGVPNKTFFNSAYSINHAIVTDTVNDYPPMNTSWFDLKIGDFNYSNYYDYGIYLEFKHKFDTDIGQDGGFITVSYDDGETWTNIIFDEEGYWSCIPQWCNENLYAENDTLYNGESGFSGHTESWVTTSFAWYNYPCKTSQIQRSDTMLLRFNFISDTLETNHEGWMIDDIKLFSVDLGSAVANLSENINYCISPNPMNSSTLIELDDTFNKIELRLYDAGGQLVRQNIHYHTNAIVLSREALVKGVYFLSIKTDQGFSGIKKLIIE